MLDFMQVMPIEILYDTRYNQYFYIIKVLRLEQGAALLSTNSFMKMVKMVFNKRLESMVSNKKYSNNNEVDNNNISKLLMIANFFKVAKLVIFMYILSYLMGMSWYIYCDLTTVENPVDERPGFIETFEMKARPDWQKAIVLSYWAFTTLSTVGFGDYYPTSNAERFLCAFLLLFGVTIFSYILGAYITILSSITRLNADFDDGDNLSKWLGLIKRFNNGREISIEYKDIIEQFFDYRW